MTLSVNQGMGEPGRAGLGLYPDAQSLVLLSFGAVCHMVKLADASGQLILQRGLDKGSQGPFSL